MVYQYGAERRGGHNKQYSSHGLNIELTAVVFATNCCFIASRINTHIKNNIL